MRKRVSVINGELKTRSENETKVLEGYFIIFNRQTELWPGVYEEIRPEAVEESLRRNDIVCLFNHSDGKVLGRTKNKTFEVKADSYGVYGKVVINLNDREACDIHARVERGDIDECSFGFYVPEGGEDVIYDSDTDTTKFIVKKAEVVEMSVVTWGAYSDTEIHARSRKNDVEKLKKADQQKRYLAFIKKNRKDEQK